MTEAKKAECKYIVGLLGAKVEGGKAYICMQLMEGEKIKRKTTGLTVCKSICLTFEYALHWQKAKSASIDSSYNETTTTYKLTVTECGKIAKRLATT